MCTQLYLFPEYAPVEKTKKTRSRKNMAARPDVSTVITREDLLTLPNGGFPVTNTFYRVKKEDEILPGIYLSPYIRRLAPTHSRQMMDWRQRFEVLKKELAEEYVRCHAKIEKEHPEWFKYGSAVNPETDSILPFVFGYPNDEENLNSHYGYMLYDNRQCIPLSLCANLVRELNIHHPTFRKSVSTGHTSKDPLYQFSKGVKVEWIEQYHMFVFHTGNLLDMRETNMSSSDLLETFPQEGDMPEDFHILSKIYAKVVTVIHHVFDALSCANGYDFYLFGKTKEEIEIEKAEVEAVVNEAGGSWKDFRKDSLTKMLDRVKENLKNDEAELMRLIGGQNVSE